MDKNKRIVAIVIVVGIVIIEISALLCGINGVLLKSTVGILGLYLGYLIPRPEERKRRKIAKMYNANGVREVEK